MQTRSLAGFILKQHKRDAKNRLPVCEKESRLTSVGQAYGCAGSYQARLEGRTPSALGAGTRIWQLSTQQRLEAAAGGWLADAILGRLFPGRTLLSDLEFSEDGITWDPKG